MAIADDIDVDFSVDRSQKELHLERNFRIIKELLADHFDQSNVAGDTRFLLYDVDNGQFERVTVGAADSGGVGFKLLRIPN
jgi:hypothetical protein